MKQVFLHKDLSTCVHTCNASYELPITASLHCYSAEFEGLSFLSFITTLTLRKKAPCAHSLRQPSNTLKCLNTSTLHTPTAAVPQRFAQNLNSETLLGLCTPCTALVPNCTFGINENKSYHYLNPLSTHSLRTLQLHSLQKSFLR
jgi:hypothetical protein